MYIATNMFMHSELKLSANNVQQQATQAVRSSPTMQQPHSIVFGAGAFNTQYDREPALSGVADVLRHAFTHGIRTIDTSAAYGPSEEILGEALAEIADEFPRDAYRLCSKCCRWETKEFAFDRETVLRSVERSLARLRTDFLDLLYIHDVEFGKPEDVLEAIQTANELKRSGKVRAIGISGYPLDVLVAAASMAQNHGIALDCVLSYCHLTLQNNQLLEYKPVFEKFGVKTVLNGSPLSMSMLRSGPTHGFHMGQLAMRERADEICGKLAEEGTEIADAATEYAFAKWSGPTVIGLRTKAQVDAAIRNREQGLKHPNPELWDRVITEFGPWHNATWEEAGAAAKRPYWREQFPALVKQVSYATL